jgi:hypothetical protein
VFSSIIEIFQPLLKLGIDGVLKWVVLKGPVALRLCAALFLIAFIVSSVWFAYDFTRMQETFLTGISTRVDDPNQKYPGLESILLSGVHPDDLQTIEGSMQVTDDFIQRFGTFATHLRQDASLTSSQSTTETSSDSQSKSKANCGSLTADLCTHLIINTIPSEGGSAALTDKYFSSADTTNKAFLFLPAMLVPTATLPRNAPDDQLVTALLQHAELIRDLNASERVAGDICKFTSHDVFADSSALIRSQPIQSYFITANGVLRICEGNITDQATVYLNQFTPTIFFPSRSFFKNAFTKSSFSSSQDQSESNLALNKVFWFTNPYLDLGGSGIVVTGCMPVAMNGNERNAALCLDFVVKNTITQIKDHLAILGGTNPFQIKCTSEPSVSCTANDQDAPATNTWSDEVVQHFNNWKQEHPQSELYGMIQIIKQTGSSIKFTVPIDHQYQAGQRSGDFLYCFIDTAKVQLWNLVRGACVGGSFLGFALFVILLIADYGARIHEQERAFSTVDRVLSDVDTPYIRLNGDDKFIFFNAAFAKLAGYQSTVEAAELSEFKFRYLLAEQSEAIYNDIDTARRNGVPIDSYVVTLRRHDKKEVSVRVHAAAVPRPIDPHGAMPETFGILLPIKEQSSGSVTQFADKRK